MTSVASSLPVCLPCVPLFKHLPIEIENEITLFRDSHIFHQKLTKSLVELQEKVYQRTAKRLQLSLQHIEILIEWRRDNDLGQDTWIECFYDIIMDDHASVYEFVEHLSFCGCCSRHMCNKTDHNDLLNKNTNFDNVNNNSQKMDYSCKCNCRHISRMMCKVVSTN